mgnify:CR=1 FL=1
MTKGRIFIKDEFKIFSSIYKDNLINKSVNTIDSMCLIVHSSLIEKYKLRFDEKIKDLYIEDFCITSYNKHNIESEVIYISSCYHKGNVNIESDLEYLNKKYEESLFEGINFKIGKRKCASLSPLELNFQIIRDEIKKEKIMEVFNMLEDKLGFERNTEPVVNLLRRIWNNDLMFDVDGNLIEKWSGIRQGNAIGSWLADVMLYELDEFMTNKYEYYVRYSDDMIVICDDIDKATNDINNIIQKYGVRLNPKKVETLTKDRWFKFLGYSICGNKISISKGRLKKFQKEVMNRTVNKRDISFLRAVNSINTYLYKGNGEYAWAKQILGTVNVEEDIELMNEFILDCLRAVKTGKKKVGGLGYVPTNKKGVVVRGIGKNVKANRLKTQKDIPEYYSLGMMRKALITDKNAYNTLVAQL